MASRSEGAGIFSVDYDTKNDRLLARDGSRLLVFDARPDHIKDGEDAIAVLGQPTFTDRHTTGVGPKLMARINSSIVDSKNQRVFVTDSANNRVMVWDIDPSRLTATPDASFVLGQKDFTSKVAGAGADGLNMPGDLYYDAATDRLFVADSGNNRVLVYDAKPGDLKTGASAIAVLGQEGFDQSAAGVGATHMNGPGVVMHDPSHQRLFVGDERNNRILVFDVAPDHLKSGEAASYEFGQPDFNGSAPRTNLKKATGAALRYMEIDPIRQRLYVAEAISLNRAMVFDVDPSRIKNNPDALSVLFQDSQGDIDARVSQYQEVWPRPDVMDPDKGILYSAASHPGGNRITMYDISGELPPAGLKAITMLGHFDGDGNLDYIERPAAGRATGRVFYPRSLTFDPVDHRLFVGDQYNNRVLMYQLDRENGVLSRDASVIFGQPDKYSAQIRPISDRTMKLPYGFAYDKGDKLLFVGDGWQNRVMVFDANPDTLKTFPKAIAEIGQKDFLTQGPGAAGPNRVSFKMVAPFSKSIGGGGAPAISMAIDPNARRMFLSDSGNNRILIFDIHRDKIKSGMSAVNVLGQPNFTSTDPLEISKNPPANVNKSAYARGFNSPAGLAFDEKRNRLFAIDALNARILVFDVTPGKVTNNMAAYAVIGQKDFTSAESVRLAPWAAPKGGVSEDDGRHHFYLPSGLAYDPVKDRLYVSDRGNERTLVFDVSPESLKGYPGAIGVFGQKDFVSDIETRAEQEEITEPRELAFDGVHQRLYQTDTPMSKVLLFDLPQSERKVSLPPRSMISYGTTDPWNGRDMPERDKRKEWSAALTTSGARTPGASVVLSHTRQVLDPRSERRSRILISETTMAAPTAGGDSSFFLDQSKGVDHMVSISNAGGGQADARFTFAGGSNVTRSIPAGGELQVKASDLFGKSVAGKSGVLRVSSDQPLSVAVVREVQTSRGEQLYVAMPQIAPFKQDGLFDNSEGAVIAGLKAGGGYDTELVLANTGTAKASGEIEIHDADTGDLVKWPRVNGAIKWSLAPGATSRVTLASPAGAPQAVFAVVKSSDANVPWAAGIVSIHQGDVLLSQTAIPARPRTSLSWTAVDTMPSLIRHGDTPPKMEFAAANPSKWPALVRFTLFDMDGKEAGRYEQIMAPNSERKWGLGDLFNVQQFKGSVRLWSDVPIALSAKRVTRSLRGEQVENEIGYTDVKAPQPSGSIALPAVWDGDGLASEIVLVNPGTDGIDGELQFNSASPETPSQIVLR